MTAIFHFRYTGSQSIHNMSPNIDIDASGVICQQLGNICQQDLDIRALRLLALQVVPIIDAEDLVRKITDGQWPVAQLDAQ